MDSKPYLIFNLGDSQYGIEAGLVKEIFPLPELESVPEAPTDIIGILNLRGEVLPVMHLALRLGRSAVSCQISDQIVVMDWQGLQIGMVVDRVEELQIIDAKTIQSQLGYGRANNINPAFIAGIAKLESELVVLIDPETLIRQADEVAAIIWEDTVQPSIDQESFIQAENTDSSGDSHTSPFLEKLEDRDRHVLDQSLGIFDMPNLPVPDLLVNEESVEISTTVSPGFGSFYDRYCPHTTLAEQETFRRRAENLRLPLVDLTDSTGLHPLAVVDLGGESFGIDLTLIQEFTSIRNLTAIPCCPNHIVGNMNLRGEIVTLVDIRSVLNLATAPVKIGTQTVVVQVKDIVAGLPVDDVSDVLYVNPSEIKPVPIAVAAGAEGYLRGTVNLFGETLSVLDLPKLLTGDRLVVNEVV